MTRIEIADERESGSGWTFLATVHANGATQRYEIRLSWADYNLWSGDGGDPPAEVARAAIAFLEEQDAPSFKETFDAAILRRHFADADDRIPDVDLA